MTDKEKRKENNRLYYQQNKDRLQAEMKTRRLENADHSAAYAKEYYQKNKRRVADQQKNNKDEIKARAARYYLLNKDRILNLTEEKKEARRQYWRNQYANDEMFKFKCKLRRLMTGAFKRIQQNKPTDTESLLGCSWIEAKEHFESLFEEGMTWSNHGEWHIDHIIPLSSANTEEEVLKLCHYTNLQPLWIEENLKKSNKLKKL